MQDNTPDPIPEDDQMLEIEALELNIPGQPMELHKVMKYASLVQNGGEAKLAIQQGYVLLNGQIETRRRKKVYADDLLGFDDEWFLITCDQPLDPSDRPAESTPPPPPRQPSSIVQDDIPEPSQKRSGRRGKIRF